MNVKFGTVIISIFAGFWAFFLGWLSSLLFVLIALMVIDFITGCAKAGTGGTND